MTGSKIIFSNGFSKFPLATAAAEMNRRGRLAALFTGAYPTRSTRRLVAALGLAQYRKVMRLLAREEDVADNLVVPFWLSETIQVIGQFLIKNAVTGTVGEWVDLQAHLLYGLRAKSLLSRYAGAKIYHFRSCFGGPSVARARSLGMLAVCDHSIANPQVVGYMSAHRGAYPSGELPRVSAFWANGLRDLERADHILVNSDFVKQTFVEFGWDSERITVIYMGLDDAFLDAVPARRNDTSGPLRLLFVGNFIERKGATILIDALERIDNFQWELEIVGSVDRGIRTRHEAFFANPRVRAYGTLSRTDIAARMTQAEIFVFPSLAEGSARVTFEAMACGCYVVTTPNSGSVVQDGQHGSVVPAGDADALAGALLRAMAYRKSLPQIGVVNAELIRTQFMQRNYGDALAAFYDRLIKSSGL